MTVFNPYVYWAQSTEKLFLKTELKNVKDPNIRFLQRKLQFDSEAVGVQGANNYSFSLDFYTDINTDDSSYKLLENKIEFTIIKKEKGWWPRLTSTPQKPTWLKVDFDKWQSEEGLSNKDEKARDIGEDYPDLYDELYKEEFGYKKEQLKIVFLGLYNLFMFVGFTYIVSVLGVLYLKDGINCFPETYETVGSAIRYLHILQLIEVILAFAGITSKGGFVPFLQVGGRLLIILLLIDPEPRIQLQPVIFYLYMIWSSVEVIRYPYYITQLYKVDVGFLTWLRYSVWIILYPMGLFSESIVIYQSIPYLDETGRMKLSLPNRYNFTFCLATFLRIYLLCFLIPIAYVLMSHMNRARVKKLRLSHEKKN